MKKKVFCDTLPKECNCSNGVCINKDETTTKTKRQKRNRNNA